MTEAFSIGAIHILWRFSKICYPYIVFEMIRLDLQHTFTTTSSWSNSSAFAFQSNENEFKPLRGQFFFKFLQKFVTKEIRLGKMIFHYIDNECVISFFWKKLQGK